MSIFTEVNALVQPVIPVHTGYAPTGAKLPYVVHRPLVLDSGDIALDGSALGWSHQTSMYVCADSVEASYNVAVAVMKALQGARVAGTTLTTSMGYTGAMVEGHYESQVTVQLNTGGI